jgi:TM2 domain-containing membrane protein YozV
MTCATHTDQPASAYCRTCGKALCQGCQRDVRGVIYCQDCLAARLEGTVPAAAANAPGAAVYASSAPVATSPGLAAILGFIPGVGAFYNGQYAKGFVHVFVFALVINLTDKIDWFGFAIPAWIFYMVFDAYATAKARLIGQPAPDPIGLNSLLSNFGLGGSPATVASSVPPPVSTPAQSTTPAQGAEYVSDPAIAAAPVATDYVDPAACASRGIPTGALILIVIGVFFLLANLGVLSFHWTADFWPVILIVIGVWLVLRRLSGTQVGR